MVNARSEQPETRRWTRAEYDSLIAQGFFEGEKIELLDGELVYMSPHGKPHSYSLGELEDLLKFQCGPKGPQVRSQRPLALHDDGEPEPDIAVVERGRYLDDHPKTALLVVEVADSTLAPDIKRKGPMYARASIPEYWIVDVPSRRVIVHFQPNPTGGNDGRGRYERIRYAQPGEILSPILLPGITIAVDEILP